MYNLKIIGLLLFITLSLRVSGVNGVNRRDVNDSPCTSYGILGMNDGKRDASYELGLTELSECDHTLDGTWRRIVYSSSEQDLNYMIPEICIQQYQCGTDFPIWINGSHPVDENPVARTACISAFYPPDTSESECCTSQIDIEIQKCEHSDSTTFFIYRLAAPPQCPAAYCATEVETTVNPLTDLPMSSSMEQGSGDNGMPGQGSSRSASDNVTQGQRGTDGDITTPQQGGESKGETKDDEESEDMPNMLLLALCIIIAALAIVAVISVSFNIYLYIRSKRQAADQRYTDFNQDQNTDISTPRASSVENPYQTVNEDSKGNSEYYDIPNMTENGKMHDL